jgi:predicted flap endonuclease-1-like 5' DNA nuclease
LDACHKNNEDLKKEVDTLVNKKGETNSFSSSYTKPKVSVASTVTPADRIKTSFDASAAKLAIGKTIKHNDLKIVEGIGPKIEELINNDGITTWEQLSKAPESRLTKILKEGGDRFLFHVPGTWPRQAGLAFEGKWKDLKELQDRLDGGKEIIK